MHVGKAISLQNLDGVRTDAEVIADEMALADRAESLGFGSIWLPEHHFSGYHMGPNVVQYLTYLAGRTSRVKLGSMVVVLPWHSPVRIAEELSVLDHLSGGRLMLGVGRGLGRLEFEGFGVAMEDSRQLFLEYSQTILEAFDSGVMARDEGLYRQAPVMIRPRPPAPLRGRAYASAVSPSSMEIMARLGFGVMIIAQKPWATTEAEVRSYAERFLEINGYTPPRPLLVSLIAVHESESAAEEMYERYIKRYSLSCIEHYEFANEGLGRVPGYEYYQSIADNIVKHGRDHYVDFLSNLQVWGTPDQVTEQLAENVRRVDGAGVLALLSYGDMPPELATQNHELFARAVLPRLSATDPERDLPVLSAEPVF